MLAKRFFTIPTTLFWPKVGVIGSCRALALFEKQANVWVFPIGITGLALNFSDRK